jgi:hypothetical protein
MENSKVNLVRSELNMASSYIDRLFHGLIDLSDLDYHPELKKLISPYYEEIDKMLCQNIFNNILRDRFEGTSISAVMFREWIVEVFNTLEMITRLGIKDDVISSYVQLINSGYRLGRELHLFCLKETDLVVELPRMITTKEMVFNSPVDEMCLGDFLADGSEQEELEDDWDELSLPLYQMNEEDLAASTLGGSILSFSMGTLKKSKELINKGHECVFEKKYSNALVFFEKSRRLHETSEVLTLIGWVYSLLDNLERGKKFCLKAIEVDPDYGPAYNDIGSYLLQEGDVNESVRWFNLAKNAPIYQNKEYPYINMGRAFLMQKKYSQALEEFKQAKTLAPHQRQITDTISKIETLMQPADESNDIFSDIAFASKNNRKTETELQ